MRHLRVALTVLVACVLMGCQDRGAWLRRGLIDPLDAQRLGYRSVWRTDLSLPGRSRVTSVQVLGDLIVLTEVPRNLVTAVDADSGNVRWTQAVGQPGKLLFAARRIGDQIVVNNETTLYILDANSGVIRQANDLQAVVSAAPAVTEGLAIFAGINGRVFAHDVASGHLIWAYQMPGYMDVAPSAGGQMVLAADTSGAYRALSAADGRLLWSGRTFARVSARPLVTELGAFIASEDTHLYALDTSSGAEMWNFLTQKPLHVGPILLGQTLYQGIDGQGLVALDAASGRQLWSMEQAAVPIVRRGQHVIVYAPPRLLSVEGPTGLTRAAAVVGNVPAVIPGPQRGLILVGERGRLERLDNQL